MAGYIGTKAVNLSTTGADIAGDADVSGALDVGGAFTSQGIDDNATSTAITIDSSENVGIGTSSPSGAKLQVTGSNYNDQLVIERTDTSSKWSLAGTGSGGFQIYDVNSGNATRMTIDSSGRLYVGTTNTAPAINNVAGFVTINGAVQSSVSGGISGYFNRMSTDGDILQFRKDGSTSGIIGVVGSNMYIGSVDTGLKVDYAANAFHPCNPSSGGSGRDNVVDLGKSNIRFDDIYATNGTIQTSDRNEKQDIEELSDAEQRVAVAAKGLMRKFRWRDAVAEKGDEARTHFGIIAQDLQAAFAAEGLDAGGYAMFISSTWWEHDVEVPAVEAVAEVLDEEGNVVTEAVEAVDAYTRTDTYDTQEEAPEGATERTRLGVRYSELLAFIIGAL
jgi:hypothetical protein